MPAQTGCSGTASNQGAEDSTVDRVCPDQSNEDIFGGRDRQDGRVAKEVVGSDHVGELNDGWDLLPHDVECHDAIGDVAVEAEALTMDADGVDSTENTDTHFWEEWWTEDVPWDPGLCESADEGYLPGALGERPCNVLDASIALQGHGVYLKQAERLVEAPCMVPQCVEGNGLGGVLIRVNWNDQAAAPSEWSFCDYEAGPCPWSEPLPCENHKFPPKLKVYWLDLENRQLHFVRNEPRLESDFYYECGEESCYSAFPSTQPVLIDEVCSAPSLYYELHPVDEWKSKIPYLCWDEPLVGSAEIQVCVMAGFSVSGYSSLITYDVLAEDLMTDDFTSLKCFAIVDGECIDLPLGLP